MKHPTGWKAIKPTPYDPIGWEQGTVKGVRKAINPKGELVSRRAFLDAQAEQSGFTSYDQATKFRAKAGKFLADWKRVHKNFKAQLGGEQLNLFKQAFYADDLKNRKLLDKRPHQPLARLLEATGDRPEGSTKDVGETE